MRHIARYPDNNVSIDVSQANIYLYISMKIKISYLSKPVRDARRASQI